jgi:pimeloyl-ACP methyl ester carboxylesterase
VDIELFRIAVPDHSLSDLRQRLRHTRWPGELEDVGWNYGLPETYLRTLTAQWDAFDWRAREQQLNELPHFRARLGDLRVHFVHVRGNGPDPLPLVMTHGWPSSFAEWLRVLGPLTDPGGFGADPADAFDVVLPSLPGYGFSDQPARSGMSPRRIAALWADLMGSLGYQRFAAHGCDWGAYVTTLLGLDHADRVLGAHMGMVSIRGARTDSVQADPDPEYRAYADRASRWRRDEQGYVSIQSTKPQTLAYGLTDSPAALAAWIAEKWWAWSDNEGDLANAIDPEDLLTTLSIYWHTNTINSANRLYYESPRDPVRLRPGQRIEVPAGFLLERAGSEDTPRSSAAAAPRIGGPPRARAELAYNVTRWTVAERGGHFPALEIPELFVSEIRDFFRPLR